MSVFEALPEDIRKELEAEYAAALSSTQQRQVRPSADRTSRANSAAPFRDAGNDRLRGRGRGAGAVVK
jgi:hypothetical protein